MPGVRSLPPPLRLLPVLAALAVAPPLARAAIVEVGPGDGWAKLEAAAPGDEVVIAPGTYRFRVHLTRQAPADRPIVIRAADPARPPVWDLSGTLVEDAPGSYGAPDRGRGCWQIAGGTNYRISGIVFTGCRNASRNAAGLRYYAGARGIVLRDCVFRENDNGLTGGTGASEVTVEHSEFDRNGNLLASAPTHNVYVYGGTFTMRHSYLHDPVQGQNLHLRARTGVVEYSLVVRARSYAIDLMTDDDLTAGARQTLLLRGNVIVQGDTQQNGSQIVAVYNDAGLAGMTMDVSLVNNTFAGNGGRAALVHLSNADGTRMSASLWNNLVAGTTRGPVLVQDAARATVTGARNGLPAGVPAGALADSVVLASPGFASPAAGDYTLAPGSGAIGAAGPAPDLPDREYFRDEVVTRRWRPRATVRDLGAFESTTTGPGLGSDGVPPPPAPPGRGATGGCGHGTGHLGALAGLALALTARRTR
jgi:hypothetical protein